jgi:hypothetical protein
MKFTHNDGGRAAAGYAGKAHDCVCRAIAIAAELPYRQVHDALHATGSSPDFGVTKQTTRKFMAALGWTWTPTMRIGSGCKVHLRDGELPNGRLVVKVSKHVVAVIDGVAHDTYDSTRDGTRCVYGYYSR